MKGSQVTAPIKSQVLTTIFIAVAYLVLGNVGYLLAIPPGNVTAVWPPSGFALACLLLLGPRALVGIFIGALLVIKTLTITGFGYTAYKDTQAKPL